MKARRGQRLFEDATRLNGTLSSIIFYKVIGSAPDLPVIREARRMVEAQRNRRRLRRQVLPPDREAPAAPQTQSVPANR